MPRKSSAYKTALTHIDAGGERGSVQLFSYSIDAV
jgi:hypothetical protein